MTKQEKIKMNNALSRKFLLISGLTLFLLLLVRNYQISTKSSAAGDTVRISFNPDKLTANTGDTLVAKIFADPSLNLSLAGYNVKLDFDNSKVEVKDVAYDFATVTQDLGDDNSKLADINARGFVFLAAEDTSGGGIALISGSQTPIARITFSYNAGSNIGTSVDISAAKSEFDRLNSDYTITRIPVTAVNSFDINGGQSNSPRYSACDLCGFCQKNGAPQPTPQRWEQCRLCLYPDTVPHPATDMLTLKIDGSDTQGPTPKPGRMYTFLGCIGTNLVSFSDSGAAASPVQAILNVIFSVAGGLSLLFILYGAYVILTSRGEARRLRYGKQILLGAVAGLAFTLASVFVVNMIASGVLKIPGF